MKTENIVTRAMNYAIKCHRETNHLYDGKPYYVHLRLVVKVAERFLAWIDVEQQDNVIAGIWVHDVIYDARQTYQMVKEATNEIVAELAYALTEEKGRNRHTRANIKYYTGILNIDHADFIKICDRIANVEYSIKHGNKKKLEMYRDENKTFVSWFSFRCEQDEGIKEMIDHLNSLFESNGK